MQNLSQQPHGDSAGIQICCGSQLSGAGSEAYVLDTAGRIGAKAILSKEIKLPSPTAVAIRILEAFKNEEESVEELARIVSLDPALALKILRLANSPIYTRSGKIETIRRAVSILGIRVLKNVALSFLIVGATPSSCQGSFDFESFWRKSITSAVSTSVISNLLHHKDDDLFLAALLQDIGEVILHLYDAERYQALLHENGPASKMRMEREAFDVDHQQLGYWFLSEWGLHSNICDLVRFHHGTEDIKQPALQKQTILRLANKLSSVFHGNDSIRDFEDFSTALSAVCSTSHEEIEEIISSAHEQTTEVLSFFEISTGNLKTCSQILQEANEELGKLNLTYEQMVLELREAKEQAERYARELATANSRLQELACRDPLTGLFNHGHFQAMLDREVARSSRYAEPFSLLLLDLDHFKSINDQHGHPVGDAVLRKVSKLALSNVRQCDVVARYGGEEFAIILPETGSRGASILAERIRKTIENADIVVNEIHINITISIGIYTCNPSISDILRSDIIGNADKALYIAKNSGRNKICIAK